MKSSASAAPDPFVPLYIHRVRIRDLGPIMDREIQFQTGVTVLLGDNNAGKSTVLRSIQLALGSTRPERSDIRCANDNGRPNQQPCALIDLHLRLNGDPDDSMLETPHSEMLERVANNLGLGLRPGNPGQAFVRTVVQSSDTGDSDDATVRRVFLQEWSDLPAASSDADAYLSAALGDAGLALSKIIECFTLNEARDLAAEVSQRRSNWGRVVSDGGFSLAERSEIEAGARELSSKVRTSGTRLNAAADRIGALKDHFKSAVRSVELNSINPDANELARQTELHVQDTVGPILPMQLQGSGIRSAASILSFDARVSLYRGTDDVSYSNTSA